MPPLVFHDSLNQIPKTTKKKNNFLLEKWAFEFLGLLLFQDLNS